MMSLKAALTCPPSALAVLRVRHVRLNPVLKAALSLNAPRIDRHQSTIARRPMVKGVLPSSRGFATGTLVS